MINIRPYYPEDYHKVMPLLKGFNSSIPNSVWKNLLEYKWENKHNYTGMLLEHENQVVGFLSYIFHHQEINGSETTFCNISSWVVKPEFRSKSLQLLSPLFKIKNIVILNLSPHENTLGVFNALRFDLLSEYEYLINPYKLKFSFLFTKRKTSINMKTLTNQNISGIKHSSEIKQLIRNHDQFSNVCFYQFIISQNGAEYIIVLAFNQKEMLVEGFKNKCKETPYKLFKRNIQFELLYSSSPALLLQFYNEIMHKLVCETNARIINVSEHYLNKTDITINYAVKTKKDRPWFFYSDNPINFTDINILYTEKVIFNF